MASIMELENKINMIKEQDPNSYKIFKSIFEVSSALGTMRFPRSFHEKAWKYFGIRENGKLVESQNETLNRLKHQRVINIYNRWTGEGSLFNSLRADRPGMKSEERDKELSWVYDYISDKASGCDFCQAEKYTPEDVFGRIRGKYCITGSNIAKYDAWSSIIFYKRHNPLEFSLSELSDYLETAGNWFEQVFRQEPHYTHPFFVWNCLDKAGASQVHGHAQILMSKNRAYAKFEALKRAARMYQDKTGKNYFQSIHLAHEAAGLTIEGDELGIMASLTPLKEKELVIYSYNSPFDDNMIKKTIFWALRTYIDQLGVTSFNLSISCPSINKDQKFPFVIKVVDRGNIFKSTADMGGMELYGSSVIADDPYRVLNVLKNNKII